MEEGVAYMMMGEGGEGEPTQLVALQAEDGSQQLAVPVIDPNTGEETYMILDQNSLEPGEDGQQFLIVGDSQQLIQGQEGVMDGVEESGYVAGHVGSDQGPAVKVGATGLSDQGHADQVGLVVFPSSSVATSLQSSCIENGQPASQPVVTLSTQSKTNKVSGDVGADRHQVKTEADQHDTLLPSSRQPRKQLLAANADHSQVRPPPPGLTGDYIKDAVLVDDTVDKISKKYLITHAQQESLRNALLMNGLDYLDTFIVKNGWRPVASGRGRGRPIKKNRRPRVIRCDQCKVEFPANVEERQLIQHVEKFHMIPQPPTLAREHNVQATTDIKLTQKSYLDPDMPIGPQNYKCSDCNKSFLQIITLLEHQKNEHSRDIEPKKEKLPSSPSPLPTTISSPLSRISGSAVTTSQSPTNINTTNTSTNLSDKDDFVDSAESPSKHKMEVIKKLADEWDDDEDDPVDGPGRETLSEEIPRPVEQVDPPPTSERPAARTNGSAETLEEISKEVEGIRTAVLRQEAGAARRSSKAGGGKEDEDEESIVADVDDILSDTDKLMSSVASVLDGSKPKSSPAKRKVEITPQSTTVLNLGEKSSKKRPTAQCEECYECFEDQEMLSWHMLNDHQ